MSIDPRLRGGDPGEFHGPSPILGPDGQPYRSVLREVDKSLLREEVAKPELMGIRAFYDPSIATGLKPGMLGVILNQAVKGDTRAYLQLAEDMEERDLNYAAALGTRKRALSRIKPTIDGTGAEPRIAEACRALVRADAFHAMVKDAVDALGKGFSVNEIVWGAKDGLWWPQGYAFRDPKFFTFDYISRTELRLAHLELIDGLELPPGKFIRHVPKLKSGIPIRGGLARMVAWAWMFKSFALKDWASFLEGYGMPIRVGKYPPSATEAERRTLLRAVGSIAADAAAIIPESMMIEFMEVKAGSDRPFATLADYLDGAIATLVLGQTLTTRDGGSLGQAKVHNEIRLDLAEDDAFDLGVTINRDLLSWFVSLNFGADKVVPKVEFRVEKPEFASVLTAALGTLVPLGLKVSQEDVRAKIGMPTPAEGAELLMPPAGPYAPPAMTSPAEDGGEPGAVPSLGLNARRGAGGEAHAGQPKICDLTGYAVSRCPCRSCRTALNGPARPAFTPGCRCPSCATALNRVAAGLPPVEPDLVDMIGLDESRDWENQTGPMLDAIMMAAARSTSYDGFQAELTKLYATLPIDGLAKRLAIATTEARGLGEVTDDV